MFVFHNDDTLLECLIDGRMFSIPPYEPFEVSSIEGTDLEKPYSIRSAKVGGELIRLCALQGLVEITSERTKAGFGFDVERAARESTVARDNAEGMMLARYVSGAHEDELAKKPVSPPSLPIQRILDKRHLDLQKDFGVTPVGYKVSEYAAKRETEMDLLRRENAEQKKDIADMKEMMTLLLDNQKLMARKETVKS